MHQLKLESDLTSQLGSYLRGTANQSATINQLTFLPKSLISIGQNPLGHFKNREGIYNKTSIYIRVAD
jgi:hypothetical protein